MRVLLVADPADSGVRRHWPLLADARDWAWQGVGLRAVALRVLVDATEAPADRGALGRYLDGLISALGAAGTDLAIACQRADEERYRRLARGARVIAGPRARRL